MNKPYEPELGQLAFGQPWQSEEATEDTNDVLDCLRSAWNVMFGPNDNPFRNTGSRYGGRSFKAHAYSWSDEEQEFNFAWRDLRVSWYKYLGRGTTQNRPLKDGEAREMLKECLMEILNDRKT